MKTCPGLDLYALAAASMQNECRCEALEEALGVFADRVGCNRAEAFDAVEKCARARLQARLEEIEDIEPGLAARLDRRPLEEQLID